MFDAQPNKTQTRGVSGEAQPEIFSRATGHTVVRDNDLRENVHPEGVAG